MTASISFAEKIELEKNDYIMTYRATDRYGQSFFCYIRCNADGYKKMLSDWETKTHALPQSYGEVIYTDFIKNPDEKAEKFLENWSQ